MGEILEFAESLWKGEADTYGYHPLSTPYGVDQVVERTWFIKNFANTIVCETDDGLGLVDPSGFFGTKLRFETVRSVTSQRLNTAIYTHGHVDHCFGVQEYIVEAKARNWPLPQIIAHEAMPKRFQRYRETNAYNALINTRQFTGGQVKVDFPSRFHHPDIVYRDRLVINVGGVEVALRHARGETGDHTWVFFPDVKVLCTGDLFFWCVPNAGNPQKVQRYCKDWAYLPAKGDPGVCEKTAQVFADRAEAETSTMAIGIYMAAARMMGEQGEKVETEEAGAWGPQVILSQDERRRKEP
jgi:glyoxylase-like metal-dependent hydrolase (beta-lactamase superfamily II)